MIRYLESLGTWSTLIHVIDILVVWFILYKLFMIIKGTRAVHLIKGLLVIVAVKFISYSLDLTTLDWIMNLVIQWGVVASIIVFQPEIRRGLEHIGRVNLFVRKEKNEDQTTKMIEELNDAIQYMAKRRIGALIVIEQDDNLQEYIRTGIPIQSLISNQLITNIFIPNTPLHDGAMIIRDFHIQAAACYLPLSENTLIPKELGTRHRAAIGLSEVSDALTIVISEETGDVSIAWKDRLFRQLSSDELKEQLHEQLTLSGETKNSESLLQMVIDFFKGGQQDVK